MYQLTAFSLRNNILGTTTSSGDTAATDVTSLTACKKIFAGLNIVHRVENLVKDANEVAGRGLELESTSAADAAEQIKLGVKIW